MSFLDRLFGFGREVLLLTARTERLSKDVEQLPHENRAFDRRLVRVEMILDMARYRAEKRQKTLRPKPKSIFVRASLQRSPYHLWAFATQESLSQPHFF